MSQYLFCDYIIGSPSFIGRWQGHAQNTPGLEISDVIYLDLRVFVIIKKLIILFLYKDTIKYFEQRTFKLTLNGN